jgi:hypothetical protein
MTTSIAETFDLVTHAEVFEERLAAAAVELSKRPALAEEQSWLESAHRSIVRARSGIGDLLTRALRLPGLESMRGDRSRVLQGAVLDAVDQLHAAMVAGGGERSPLIETVYRNMKPTVTMRRSTRDELEKYCAEIEKRLASSYAQRILADPAYAVLEPALERLRRAQAEWREFLTPLPPDAAEARALREELEAVARRLELPSRQARLIAEAALMPVDGLLEASHILDKPKRRTARAARPEAESERPSAPAPAPKSEPPPASEDEED